MKTDPFNGETITKAELINLIKDLDPDDKICISFDGCEWGITGLKFVSRYDEKLRDISDKDKCDICLSTGM